jgi:hypothetical protein
VTKILLFSINKSERCIPLPRGFEPTRRAICASLKATSGLSESNISTNKGNAQSFNSIITPLTACRACGKSSSCKMIG